MKFNFATCILWQSTFNVLVHASTLVTVNFFLDEWCKNPGTITAVAQLPLNVCVATPGLVAFDAAQVSCPSGALHIYTYNSATCPYGVSYTEDPGSCSWPYINGAISAIVLACGSEPSSLLSTTTVSVADVVTQAPASSTAGVATSVATTTTSQGAPAGTSSSGSSSSPSSSSSPATGWNSLSYGEKVGTIVAIAMGLPAIILALITVKLMMK